MEAPAFAALDGIGKSHIRAFQGAKILLKGDLLSASLIQFPVTLSQNSEACKEGYSFRVLSEPISIPYRKPNSEVGIMKDSSFNTCARKEGGSLVIALNKGAPSNGACRGND